MKKKKSIQNHHICYLEKDGVEFVVPIFKGEHWILTQINRRKNISEGFIVALRKYTEKNIKVQHLGEFFISNKEKFKK